MTDRATEDALAALHTKLAEDLLERVENGETVVDKQGEVHTVKVSAATLNVVRQFLKDNDIKAMPARSSPLERLAQAVPANFVPFEGDESAGATH